jgi:hypothetical protein
MKELTVKKWLKSVLFQLLRLASDCAFLADNASREGHTLAALQSATELFIGLARAARTVASGFPHVTFPYCIANANDHCILALLRIIL